MVGQTEHYRLLKNQHDKYATVDGISFLSVNLQFISRYFDINEVKEWFEGHLQQFGGMDFFELDRDLDYDFWTDERNWNLRDFNDDQIMGKKVDEAKIKTRLNYMQDHLDERYRTSFLPEKRDSLGTALSAISTDKLAGPDMLQNAYNSVVGDLIVVLKELGERVRRYKPTRDDFVQLYEGLEKKYATEYERRSAERRLDEMDRDCYGAEFDDWVEWRGEYIRRFLEGRFLIGCEIMTRSGSGKMRGEALDEMIFEEEVDELLLKRYTLLRKLVGKDERRLVFDKPQVVGKYIYEHRRELTNKDIASFFGMKLYVERIQERMYPSTREIDIYAIEAFSARAVLDYVGQLNVEGDERNRFRERFWVKLMQRHEELIEQAYGKPKCCFVPGRAEVDKDFSKKFVCCVIGHLADKEVDYMSAKVDISAMLNEGSDPNNARIKNMQQGLQDYPSDVAAVVDQVMFEAGTE